MTVAYWGVWIAAAILIVKYAGPVLVPFIIAFIIAGILAKPLDRLSQKTHINRKFLAVLCVVLIYLLIGTALFLLGDKLIGYMRRLFQELPYFFSGSIYPKLEELFNWISEKFSLLDPEAAETIQDSAAVILQDFASFVTKLSTKTVSFAAGFVTGVPAILVKITVTIIVTVFAAADYHIFIRFIKKHLPEDKKLLLREAKTYIGSTLVKMIISYAKIISLSFVELWIGLSVIRIPNAMLLALIISFIDILPILGTGTVLIPWGIIALCIGEIRIGAGVLILYVVITIIRNIVEPKLVGQQINLHPVVTFACMLLGLKFLGIIGMFGFPIAVALLNNMNERGIIQLSKKTDEN